MSKVFFNNNNQVVRKQHDFLVPKPKPKRYTNQETYATKESKKLNRLERLRKRMRTYRERSLSKEQIEMTNYNNLYPSVGFNMYCKEQESRHEVVITEMELLEQQRSEVIFSFDESYLDSILSSLDSNDVVRDDSILCWICGQFVSSKDELLQHASEQHFPEWLESNAASWSHNRNGPSPTISCPKCSRLFHEMPSFKDHVMREHEGLLTWLQFNGFDLSS